MAYVDTRSKCLEICHQLLHHRYECHYSEQANRWAWKTYAVPTFPFFSDCSGTFTAIDWWAGAGDPNDVSFGYGDTATLLHAATVDNRIIKKAQMLPADGCLFADPSNPALPHHVAMALQDGTHRDPLFFNMGSSQDPSIQPLSVLSTIGTPIFFRNRTRHRS